MSGRHPFEKLTREFTPERRARVAARKHELRKAMGGQLKIVAEFPHGNVAITNFSEAGDETASS